MWPILAGMAISAIGGAISSNQNKKAAEAAAKAVESNKVDIAKLVKDARLNAEENLKRSVELESKYFPETSALRTATGQNLLNQLTGTPAQQREQAVQRILDVGAGGGTPSGFGSPLLKSAADRILADLDLGGTLDAETQAEVVRGGLAAGGNAGILGSEAGRGIVARDLGLTSLALRQSRQNAALQAGSLQLQELQQYLASLGLGVDATTGQLSQAGGLFGLLSGQPLPEAGLSATDIANATVGQSNQAQQSAVDLAAIRAANNAATVNSITSSLQQGLGLYAGLQGGAKTAAAKKTGSEMWL